jgi:predicted MPP superfamily phosphohydrolase
VDRAEPQHPEQPEQPAATERRRARTASLAMLGWLRWAGVAGVTAATKTAAAIRWLRIRTPRWVPRLAGRIAVALIGVVVGLLLGAHVSREVGPFEANLSLTPNVHGETVLRVPPLGALEFNTHDGPLRLDVQLTKLNQAKAQDLLRDPRLFANVGDQAATDVRAAVGALLVKSTLCAIAGAVLLSALVYRRRREPLIATGLAVVLLASTAGAAALTRHPNSLREPRYTGLLANAPSLIGSAESILDRFDTYQQELAGLVQNVSRLYAAASTLPAYQPDDSTIRVLHISDLHLNPTAYTIVKSLVDQYKINIVVDTGDITDWGSEPESRYVASIGRLGVPYVFIRGNHDSARTAAAVAAQRNAVVLDGKAPRDVGGLTFLGIGDPRFTPDKATRHDHAPTELVTSVGERLATIVEGMARPPDVAMLHDPASAEPLIGKVPLILAGHLHARQAESKDSTLLLVEGSTGGAGLRGLEGEKPTPIECSVLYFDTTTKRLQAYDDITIGGLGETEATIERHLVPARASAEPR